MKKIIAASLFAGFFASFGATAAPVNVPLVAATPVAVGNVTTDINLARQFSIVALGNRAGFVKNSFDSTLSANVIAFVLDDAADSRFGVSAGSNKGYVVFTGSSVGGSVSQCGDLIAKGTANLAASAVTGAEMDLDEPNGCAP